MLSYQSQSNGSLNPYRRVIIVQVDFDNQRCEVRDLVMRTNLYVSLQFATGFFFQYPIVNEEWIITQMLGNWVFLCKTSTQNTDFVKMSEGAQGDLFVSAPHDLVLSSKTGRIRSDSLVIQQPIYNIWNMAAVSPDNNTSTNIGTLTLADPGNQSVAEIAALNQLRIKETGTYNISFQITNATLVANRAFVQMRVNLSRLRRGYFIGEDKGFVQATMALQEDDLLDFLIYHSHGSTLTFTGQIEITQVR